MGKLKVLRCPSAPDNVEAPLLAISRGTPGLEYTVGLGVDENLFSGGPGNQVITARPPINTNKNTVCNGCRSTHLTPRSTVPTGRAWIGSPSSQRRRSSARSAALV